MYNEIIHERLEGLRRAMKAEGADYCLFVTADFHSSEYVCDHFKAREYFSGFSGSNGDLLVWKDGAALWTDGRYFLQAAEQLEGTGIELMKMGMKNVPTVEEYLEKHMLPGERLATDGRCIPLSRGNSLKKVCEKVNAKACADAENPFESGLILTDLSERVWTDRPGLPEGPARLLTPKDTGESRSRRLARVREAMKNEGADVLVLSSLDDISWLFLIRGDDIEYNPVVLSYAVIFEDHAVLYIDRKKISDETADELKADEVVLADYDDICGDLSKLGKEGSGRTVMVDPGSISYMLYSSVSAENASKGGTDNASKDNERSVNIIERECPITLMKACKTPEETEFERRAHIKDGVAVTKLLYCLHKLRESGEFKNGTRQVTELEVAEKLLNLRKEQKGFIYESFAPIVATADHGAIIHYEPDEKSNAVIRKDAFLLMDTGGQYAEGTTDITRTVMMGEGTEEEKKLYTAVLCGNLRLASAVFPEGTSGQNLDILARQKLWECGLDYRHGTGHGVGFILNVHEGPQNINLKGRGGKITPYFREGMITSDEPGVYLDGRFGIRLENMMVCLPVTNENEGEKLRKAQGHSDMNPEYAAEYGPFYRFETLTMVPFDRRSIEPAFMSDSDIELLNAYHRKVYETISPYLNDEEKEWLRVETEPVTRRTAVL